MRKLARTKTRGIKKSYKVQKKSDEMRIGMGERVCAHPIVAHVAWSYHQHLPTYVYVHI